MRSKSNTESSENQTWFVLFCPQESFLFHWSVMLFLSVSKTLFNSIVKILVERLPHNWFEWISSVSTICDHDHETDTAHRFCSTIKSDNLWPQNSSDNFFDTCGFDMRHLFAYFNAARPNTSKMLLWAPSASVTFHLDVSIQSAPPRDIDFPILYSDREILWWCKW